MRQLQVFVKEVDLDGGGEFNSTLPCPLSTYVLVVVVGFFSRDLQYSKNFDDVSCVPWASITTTTS